MFVRSLYGRSDVLETPARRVTGTYRQPRRAPYEMGQVMIRIGPVSSLCYGYVPMIGHEVEVEVVRDILAVITRTSIV